MLITSATEEGKVSPITSDCDLQ